MPHIEQDGTSEYSKLLEHLTKAQEVSSAITECSTDAHGLEPDEIQFAEVVNDFLMENGFCE